MCIRDRSSCRPPPVTRQAGGGEQFTVASQRVVSVTGPPPFAVYTQILVLLVSTVALTLTTLFVPGGQVTGTTHKLVVSELFGANSTVIVGQPSVWSSITAIKGSVDELW